MKIFVTVGTTVFDSMIEAADKCAAELKQYQFTFQTAVGAYKPLHGTSFEFVDGIDGYFDDADVIITHAGAGSTYTLLDLHKKIVVVPNLERVDKHQSDLANFLEENNYALVVWNLDRLLDILQSIEIFQPSVFEKESFFKAEEISLIILS